MPNEKKPKNKCVEYLRHAEYYDMQSTFDELYARSQAGENCVVHCEDGNFTMPKLSIVFQEEV